MYLIVNYLDGKVELPMSFDWYARLVELYGLYDATRFSLLVAKLEIEDTMYHENLVGFTKPTDGFPAQ